MSQLLDAAPEPHIRDVADSLSAHLRAVTFHDLPPAVVTVAKCCVLDFLGVALAGSLEPLARILRTEVGEQGGGGRATVVGQSGGAAPAFAALVNGATGHALDYDDTHLLLCGHPSVTVFPAVLATGEQLSVDGAQLLTAFVVGVEACCRIGAVVNPEHYAAGWHATGTLGTYGAAAACAHLLGLAPGPWQEAMGLAATQAAGLKSTFGTMAKPLNAGHAAMTGLLAARLANGGFTSTSQAAGDGVAATHAAEAARKRDDAFSITDVLFKYHASCMLTHGAIEAVTALRRRNRLDTRNVATIEIRVPSAYLDVCNQQRPRTGLEGKFSLTVTAALALLGERTGDPSVFSDRTVQRPDVVAVRDRVRVVDAPEHALGVTTVTIATTGGQTHSATVDIDAPARDPREQWDRVRGKFHGLADPVIGADRARLLAECVAGLDEVRDVHELTELWQPGRRRSDQV